MTCGHVGCCDNSPNRHATAHWHAHQDHPVIRSFEPEEDWWWCYEDQLSFDVPGTAPAPSHPTRKSLDRGCSGDAGVLTVDAPRAMLAVALGIVMLNQTR